MKTILVLALVTLCQGVTKFEPKPLDELMDDMLDHTPLSDNHSKHKDQAFLTGVFRKYAVLGNDAEGEMNGKRVLNEFNAKWAAREILTEWKGLAGGELDTFINSDKFNKIFKEFDYNNSGTIDQKDAYFWARKMVGEDYVGQVTSEA